MATLIRPNGMKTEVHPCNGTDFSLRELKAAIGGGHIEVIRLNQRDVMVLDEDGKGKGLPPNFEATILLAVKNMNPEEDMVMIAPGIMAVALQIHDFVVGQVLVCDVNQIR
jgi:hypothetical protein